MVQALLEHDKVTYYYREVVLLRSGLIRQVHCIKYPHNIYTSSYIARNNCHSKSWTLQGLYILQTGIQISKASFCLPMS